MLKRIPERSGLYCGVTLLTLICLFCFRLIPGTPFGVYAMGEEKSYHQRDGIHTPCSFFETVNVTDDVRFDNGSYLHDDILIPRHMVGIYDYVYKNLAERIDVAPHMRGCVCKLKACLNICCPWGSIYNSSSGSCVPAMDHLWPEPFLNVTFGENNTQLMPIFKQFAIQNFRPCLEMFSLQPELNSYDSWVLFSNGTMLREDDNVYINKNEYCLVPTIVNDTDIYYTINPANCETANEYGTVKIINAYTMLFSIPFMLLTIAVYLVIPDLRNQHGKSLVCYLFGLSVGYIALCCISLLKNLYPDSLSCKIYGYTAYYFFMSAFFWLSVISFDLWHNFRGTRGINRSQEKKRFLFYSLYSWGSALAFLIFTWYAQEQTDWPADLKPGIGNGTYCWLDMRNWSTMIYFFGPILLIIVANTVMYVMTSIKIHTVQREMARIIAREDSTKNLRTEKDKFGLFLRLFLIMGMTWSSEILSYFVGTDKTFSKVFYISDLCNAMQGFLIFMLFVLKKKVKQLIINRCASVRDSSNQRQSQYSTKTTSSSLGNLTMQEKNNAEKPLVTDHQQQQRTTSFR